MIVETLILVYNNKIQKSNKKKTKIEASNAWMTLATKNGKYLILVELMMLITCMWTESPPKESIIAVKILFNFNGIFRTLTYFKPWVISTNPFKILWL